MAKAIIFVGGLIVLYTIVAKVIGIPELADYLPVSWFGGQADGTEYYKILGSSEKSYSWLYTLVIGALLVVSGFLIKYFGKNGSV